ncbi:hypothetical protein MNBD_BACTEROID06-1650 [hydrothermal vent metagenome]|uniref:Anti-sigma factor n=1 Tax=hydrothermal vent metagenome TaxID=652676 RepID=A0A3B0U707_9ZZZZ
MQDDLEKFVKEHRDGFDDLSPDENVWKGIHKELSFNVRSKQKMFVWQAAAVILFAFSIGLTLYINKDMLAPNENAVVYEHDTEFIEAEYYYVSVINTRQQLIKTVAKTYPEVENDFESDWEILDKSYKKLKQEYEKNQNEEIRSALLQNLRARIGLLDRQVEVLEQIKKASNNSIDI